MKVLVLGGDGFCGWPTSLHLSQQGHQVTIVDDFSRRRIDAELGVSSLTPIRPLSERLSAWKAITGLRIEFFEINVAAEYPRLKSLLSKLQPDVVIHFAEQRAAPYSMKSASHKIYTVNNNLNATNNVLAAIVDVGIDPHIVHLGSMGVYGYGTSGIKLPEGYLEIKTASIDGEEITREILYPADPGSIYHMTKTQDQLFFAFYNKNDSLRITDLHQGIVWGTQTEESQKDERLINRFDYDGDYGTVLNRFLVQSAINYPLTVHGKGGQTRAFIHIQDTVRCINLTIENPPKTGEKVQIINQMTETHTVRDLARMVSEKTGVTSNSIPNPRKENEDNDLFVSNNTLIGLGLKPILLEDGLMTEIFEIAKMYSSRCNLEKIPCLSKW